MEPDNRRMTVSTIRDYKVGDKVIFGRSHGEQTEGTVMKVNRTKLKVRQDESRGTMRSYPVGTVWTVPPSLCRKIGAGAPVGTPLVAKPTTTLKVGQTVEYEGYDWASRSKGQVKGIITKVGVQDYEVYGTTGTRTLDAALVKAAPKRPFDEVKGIIQGVYAGLSPENLTCDGELPRAQVQRRSAELHRALKALFIEAGREVLESEAYGFKSYAGETTPVSRSSRTATAKASGFKKGDKVSFDDGKGNKVVGYVKSVNQKTLTVNPEGATRGRYWRVAPALCTKVTDTPKQPAQDKPYSGPIRSLDDLFD